MRLFRLAGLLGAVVVVALTSAVAATAKSAAFHTGTYNLKPAGYTVTLKHVQCGGKLQFCVALPKSPAILCMGGPDYTFRVGNFATPAALPSSGKVTEHAPFTVPGALLSGEAQTGQSAFSIAFKKNGTASGYVEVNFTYPLFSGQSTPVKCSGKVSFTAKLA
jgi:hypothetical protein